MAEHPGAVSPLDWALQYARLGYPVLPLLPRGKAPLVVPELGFARGKNDATTSEERLVRVWQAYPEANVGIVPGPGVLVLDLDDPMVYSALVLVLPEAGRAPRALSGSGGSHVWFRLPEGIGEMPARAKPLPNLPLDLRGMGKAYLVAPPSEHPSGGRYRWLRPLVREEELPVLPVWFARWLKGEERRAEPPRPSGMPPAPPQGLSRERAYALGELRRREEEMAATPEGRRHMELVRHAVALWAWVLRGALSEVEVEEALRRGARRSGLEDPEIEGVLVWVRRTRPVRMWME